MTDIGITGVSYHPLFPLKGYFLFELKLNPRVLQIFPIHVFRLEAIAIHILHLQLQIYMILKFYLMWQQTFLF